jgi:hypothetical protein
MTIAEAERIRAINKRVELGEMHRDDSMFLLSLLMPEAMRTYDPKFGDDRACQCGHIYYRHFDTYDDMYPIGCKYCECVDFVGV